MRVDFNFSPKRLRRIRIAGGFKSQASLARALGLKRQYVNNWEVGFCKPSLEMLHVIASLCGAKMEEFFDTVRSEQD